MNISAIIAEYNPLHKGHLFQIKKTKEITKCDGLLCIMSGNFVQRGEPAVIDKWNRAKMALENGVDLVLELPVVFSLSSAEFFAHGAVSILNSLGVVNNICFGSESGDIDLIWSMAKILSNEPEEYKELLRLYIRQGNTFPASRSKALVEYIGKTTPLCADYIETVMNTSNNILGIEYCKSLIKNRSLISPVTIKREGGAYNSEEIDERFSSATAIRRLMRENVALDTLRNQVSENSFKIIEELIYSNYNFTYAPSMFPYIKYKCLQDRNCALNLPDASEGLHNRVYEAVTLANTYDEILTKAKTKRYTYTRISRILTQLFIGFDKFNSEEMRNRKPSYVRVLGFNSKGAQILKRIKEQDSINVYTKLPSAADDMLQLDLMSTEMYSLLNRNVKLKDDYHISPIIYK